MRNLNRDVIDLVSEGNVCTALNEDGCMYHDFQTCPSGGRNLIPRPRNKCYYAVPPHEIYETWNPYQNLLRELVFEYTNMSPEEKAKKDIENFFYHSFIGQSSRSKVSEVVTPAIFPEEYDKALIRKRSLNL